MTSLFSCFKVGCRALEVAEGSSPRLRMPGESMSLLLVSCISSVFCYCFLDIFGVFGNLWITLVCWLRCCFWGSNSDHCPVWLVSCVFHFPLVFLNDLH